MSNWGHRTKTQIDWAAELACWALVLGVAAVAGGAGGWIATLVGSALPAVCG